jgi:hypothetical protein
MKDMQHALLNNKWQTMLRRSCLEGMGVYGRLLEILKKIFGKFCDINLNCCHKRVTFSPVHAMKAYRGSRGTAPFILSLLTSLPSVHLFVIVSLVVVVHVMTKFVF